MSKKVNPELTKSEALKLSWVNRESFRGYDRSKGSSYNSWRAIVYTTKGKAIGFPQEWMEYDVFMCEVQGEWSLGKIAKRLDTTKPHSRENTHWDDKGTENLGKLVRFEYDGRTQTLLEWSAELNLSYQGVRQRYFKGKDYTPEEVLFGKERKTKCKHEKSNEVRTLRMLGAYKLSDKQKGFSCDITIEYMRDLIKCGCTYCGDMSRVGLDRIDNSKGHTMDNVVPACYECNVARNNNFSYEEMLIIGKTIKTIKEARIV
jgi:hypothetical protein